MPASAHPVHLPAIPTVLLVAAKSQTDSIIRDLLMIQAISTDNADPVAEAMAALSRTLAGSFKPVHEEMKRQAWASWDRGDLLTDIHLALPLHVADAARDYKQALADADSYARSGELLPLASPTTHRIFRRWYLDAIVTQLHAAAAGETAEVPEPFLVTLLAEVDQFLDAGR
jgi:hypothetical protein